MKRFFTYIAILALAVACNDELYGPEETPLTPDAAGSVEIAVSDVTDNSFKVTVTPSGNVAYYSYLVDAAAAKELSAETLFKVGYKGVAQGTVKYSAEEPSYTFEVKADPNTTYQIYAVAGSEMGFVSAVVTKSVLTTDTVSPAYKAVESEGHQVLFTFSETVKRNVEGGAIKVPYYASYSPEFEATAASAGEITVPEDSITVAGNQALIAVPGLPTGALYTISIPAGAFVDAVGQKLPGYTSSFVMAEDSKGNLSPAPKGFYGEAEYVELPMLGELDVETFSDWTDSFVIPVESEYAYAGTSEEIFVTVTYESTNKVVEHTLTPDIHYAVTSAGLVICLPEQPDFGADVTINVPAGTIYDVYGNVCEAWEITALHSYGYTIEDAIGTYAFTAPDNVRQSYITSKFVIEESDNDDNGNIMITSILGIPCMANIYGTFDLDSGTLTFGGTQKFYEYVDNGETPDDESDDAVISYYFYTYAEDNYVLNMPKSGVLSGPNDYLGIAIAVNGKLSKYEYLFLDMEAQKVEAEESVAPTSNQIIKLKGYSPVNPK